MSEPTVSGIQFNRAEMGAAPASAKACARCGAALTSYYLAAQEMICPNCAQTELANDSATARLPAALGLGVLTALGGALAYYLFIVLTGYSMAIVTIGVAWVIARAMRKASHGRGGTAYQVSAALLVYLSVGIAWLGVGLHHSTLPLSPALLIRLLPLVVTLPLRIMEHSPLEIVIIGFAVLHAWRTMRLDIQPIQGPFQLKTS